MKHRLNLYITIFCLLFPTTAFSATASLVGSPESLVKQNKVADLEMLKRIENDRDLEELKKAGIVVPLPLSAKIDSRLDEKWRYCLQCTSDFLDDLAVDFIDRFGRQFQVNSAVRTIERQLEIRRGDKNNPENINAAPTEGQRASPHLTGATIDIAKIGLSSEELDWLRERLLLFEDRDFVEATEEWEQLCFHVMVFNSYCDHALATK